MITIRNLTKGSVVFNLPHAFACSEDACTCTRTKVGVEEHNPKTGDRAIRHVNRRLGASITLFPKGHRDAGKDAKWLDRVTDLPPHVRRVPEIANALRAGKIAIDDQVPAAPTTPAADAAVKE